MSPEVVVSNIVNEKSEDKGHGNKFCLVADCNRQDHRQSKNNVNELKISFCACCSAVTYVSRVEVEVNQSHEHKYKEKSTGKLKVLLKSSVTPDFY